MRRYLVTLAALGAAFFLSGATALEAQRITSPYRYIEETQSLSVFAGYLLTQGLDPDLGPQAAPTVGVRYNLRLGGPIAGEAALRFIPSERTIFAARGVDPSDPTRTIPIDVGTASMPLLLAEAGIRLNVTGPRTWNGLAPYALATGGVVANLRGRTAAEEDIPEDEHFSFGPGFAVGIGGGTDWFLTQRISLRAEVRDQIWRLSIPQGLTEQGARDNRWTNNLGLSLGAAYHF
ncbi:MAG TPA: hypothetical protein VGR27_00290 [Longimicrobiaceae bacterium]|nr:hypothetical protein [Longimicrobiaceae bacterium]